MSSSLDLDQVLYARAAWRKAILVPLWIFQVTLLLGLMGIFAYRLAETFEHYEEHNMLGDMPIVEVVWEATNVGFNLIALLLNILEIARKATERLTPFMMVCSHVIKLTLAFGVLALDIVAYLQRIDGHYSTIGLSLDCGLLAATLTTFIYSVITYRRLLKYDDYDLTANAQTRGFVPGNEALELGHQHHHDHPNAQTSGITTTRTTELHYSDSSYPSQTQAGFPASTTTATATAHPTPTPSPSGSVLKREVDRAIGAEFGWSTPPPPPPGAGPDPAVNRSGSVVLGGGRVAVHHGPPVVAAVEGGGLQRQHSWVTERGVVTDGLDEEEDGGGTVMGGVGLGVSGGGGGGREGGRLVQGRREEDEEALLSGK